MWMNSASHCQIVSEKSYLNDQVIYRLTNGCCSVYLGLGVITAVLYVFIR